jgi:hypothetical protein
MSAENDTAVAMLDSIASELWYVSLIRLIDVETLSPYWGATASLTRARAITVTGPTPDATLAALAIQAIDSLTFMLPASTPVLDNCSTEMLRLLLMRSRSQLESPPIWTATMWLRGQGVVSAVGQMPNEALRNLVTLITLPPLQ